MEKEGPGTFTWVRKVAAEIEGEQGRGEAGGVTRDRGCPHPLFGRSAIYKGAERVGAPVVPAGKRRAGGGTRGPGVAGGE